MKQFLVLLLCVLLPIGILSQETIPDLPCHRCFGNSYCNSGSDPNFIGSIRNATCTQTGISGLSESEDPWTSHVQNLIENQFNQANPHNVTTRWEYNCITATVIEPHDSHTVRTCLRRIIQVGTGATAPEPICDVIAQAVQPGNVYNGTLRCQSCQSDRCNSHTLLSNVPGASNVISVSVGTVMAMAILLIKFIY